MNNAYHYSNTQNRLTDMDRTTILRDLVHAINRGDRADALDMLYRYVPNEEQRERVEQYRREKIR